MDPMIIDKILASVLGETYGQIVSLIVQVIGIASIIVRLTPTLKDDDALKGVVKFLGKYVALNRGSGTK